MFDIPGNAADRLRAYVCENRTGLLNAALLLGGQAWLKRTQQLVDDILSAPTYTRRIHLQVDALLALLSLKDVHEEERPEAGYFANLDPAAPYVEEICLLADGLAEAIAATAPDRKIPAHNSSNLCHRGGVIMDQRNEGPLLAAILDAFEAAHGASDTLNTVKESWAPDSLLQQQIAELDCLLDNPGLFEPRTLDRVHVILRALQHASELEWVTEFPPDENCMSGTVEHSFFTERGRMIMQAYLDVADLQSALRRVKDLVQVEEIAAALKQRG